MGPTHALPIFALVVLCVAVTAVQNGVSHPTPGIGDFHTWTKVNPTPAPISSRLDGLCRGPTRAEKASLASDPHMHKSITVWVNKIGAKAMTTGGRFPVGTVIVKEKHVQSSDRVDMSTVMIKRAPGYNPRCGNWEFQTLDASGKIVTSSGRIPSCMKCHEGQVALDYTFRTYVPSP
jgi:hypothetical protein